MDKKTQEQKIIDLQHKSNDLEPTSEKRGSFYQSTNSFSEIFYSTIGTQNAYKEPSNEELKSILETDLNEEPGNFDDILSQINKKVIPPGLNPVSGSHFGYIPGGGLFSSAIGDFISSLINRYAGVFYASPGAVTLEYRLIKWMSGLIGYGEGSGGFISSGGSIANLTAIYSARESAGIKPSIISRTVVYLGQQTHHSIRKGLKICGMQDCIKRIIPLDDYGRMISTELRSCIRKDLKSGLIPWMIVASAGTTDQGAIDPINEIANISQEFNLWYHVDAAYGGFFLLTNEGQEKLRGIKKADSVVLDPHKGLFLPYGSGALIVKNVNYLISANEYQANYMQDTIVDSNRIFSPAEVSPELSRSFRGLGMWIPLKTHGVKAFRYALEEKLELTRYLWGWLKNLDEIKVSSSPDLTTFLFRWEPLKRSKRYSDSTYNKVNKDLHGKLLKRGRVFISTTSFDDKLWLRITILSIRTHLDQVKIFQRELLDCIQLIRDE